MNLPTIFLFIISATTLPTSSLGGSSSSSSLTTDPLLGVAPEDARYYSSSQKIKCKDGSEKFSKAQLNDDYCDCPDGTDEPGTSACPYGKFYCHNEGHVPIRLFSSRVNDGICDCCDGSDEYNSKVKCPNTCWEAGKVAKDKLKNKIAMYQEGIVIRKQEVEQAKLALAKDRGELSKLKSEEKLLKRTVQQLRDRKERIEKAEERQRTLKEKEERDKIEAEEKNSKLPEEVNPEKSDGEIRDEDDGSATEIIRDDGIGLVGENPSGLHAVEGRDYLVKTVSEEDLFVSSEPFVDTGSKEHDASNNTEGMSKEELGQLVASRWTGEKTEKESGEASDGDDYQEKSKVGKIPEYLHDEVDVGDTLETSNNSKKYEYSNGENGFDDDFPLEDFGNFGSHYDTDSDSDSDDEFDLSDIAIESIFSWVDKVKRKIWSILDAYNLFETPIDKAEVDQVHEEYDKSSVKLSRIQSRISSLSEKLKHDFGPEKEFYLFHGRCFESKEDKYTYKVCPFKEASQLEGHSTIRLGRWEKFDDSYQAMIFSEGDRCWNGPDRSLKVNLRCGLKNEISDVDEQSRCEYDALLSTPALCAEDKLEELQDELAAINGEGPQSRDEL